ncbi:ribosomal protein S9/S16-domain-containing protein [Vararia minispora EC-137]|uniref:Ribosomal protein S9/S16-domain-containing protein n=1 Tax=Vararia minispora EC-137 TaxID=1314806 RepID=A0ACB8QJ86_9AGAM|nr:ribosomal protein S9/S16-domain-containing protein [Vararia minispora EC-137]
MFNEPDPKTKAKPGSASFYTQRVEYNDQLLQLQNASNSARKVLKELELFPLPKHALDSLPPLHSYWRSRRDMAADLFDKTLNTRQYKKVVRVLSRLNEYQTIARAAGCDQLADSVSDVIRLYERPGKHTILGHGSRGLARFDRFGRTYSVGRRKTSSARVWMIPVLHEDTETVRDAAAERAALEAQLFKGEEPQIKELPSPPTTTILVNGRPMRDIFPSVLDRERIVRPLKIAGVLGAYNVFALVRGGGTTGQSGAVAQAIAKGLATHEPEMKTTLKKAKLLRRDPRMVERKKTGQPKARKRYAWVKR